MKHYNSSGLQSTFDVPKTSGTTTNQNANTTTSAPSGDKNQESGLNEWLNKGSQLIIQGGQIVSAISQQRQTSGVAQQRQAIKNACGRKPLFGRKKKEEYRKCAEGVIGSTTTDTNTGGTDDTKTLGGGGGSTSPILIGVGVLALGVIGFLLYKKFKK